MAQPLPYTGLNENHTLTFAGYYVATGSAVTIELPFRPDRLEVINYTKSGTAGEVARFNWFRGFPAGDAVLEKVIADNGATGDQNFSLEATNGVTVADVSAGVDNSIFSISGATQASPCVITTAAHGIAVGDYVRGRITGVKGMTELNDIDRNPYKMKAISSTTFELYDLNDNPIDSSSFSAYTSGGEVNILTHNSDVTSPIEYKKPKYQLTLGSAIAANDGDQLYFVAYKYSTYKDLGDSANW